MGLCTSRPRADEDGFQGDELARGSEYSWTVKAGDSWLPRRSDTTSAPHSGRITNTVYSSDRSLRITNAANSGDRSGRQQLQFLGLGRSLTLPLGQGGCERQASAQLTPRSELQLQYSASTKVGTMRRDAYDSTPTSMLLLGQRAEAPRVDVAAEAPRTDVAAEAQPAMLTRVEAAVVNAAQGCGPGG
uniref:Uncharacterized protein n=1 Tax=Chlamydomonas euryale TaxID=1486919 RepID=A0A7R9YS11_9CHLO|mmetsp:Transcript_1881/g.4986  ORF Transcript_1881/g.4986 Transcript_1881/m.4986 type:complete len:188 (+) Transcript_1881:655-1218(+)|eukprot:356345-Chlamydomonas_euryale.AAC.6